MRYCETSLWDKPFGEARYLCPLGYAWTNAQATPANYTLMKYTFCEAPLAGTGQYSYLDDPSTPASEGFGLMFYVSRWYDPSLGRFAQADTIVPSGAQGLDRYAYVNNNPVRFNDPSGHKCQPEDECETPRGDKPVDVPLTDQGRKQYELYLQWQTAYGKMTIEQFIGLTLLFESSSLANTIVSGTGRTVLNFLMEISARQIWAATSKDGRSIPYCTSQSCTNGVFNFLGVFAESAQSSRTPMDLPKGYSTIKDALAKAAEIGESVMNPTNPDWKTWDNDKPSDWGNSSNWSEAFSNKSPNFFSRIPADYNHLMGSSWNQYIYKNGDFFILTANQVATWTYYFGVQ